MSRERFHDALTDLAAGGPASAPLAAHLEECAACQRELRALREALALADAALGELAAAEPSPEFRARLRQRADEARGDADAVRFAWRWPWLATAAAICAAVVVATAWRVGPGRDASVASVTVSAPATTTTTQPVPVAGPELAAPSGSPQSSASAGGTARGASVGLASPVRSRAPRSASRSIQPEVLVPAGEQRALLQFIALVHEQKATPPALLAAGEPSPELGEPRDIHIEPLEITPLDPAEAQGME